MVRAVLPGVEDADDVGVRQPGRRPRLALETPDATGVGQLLRLGHLQGHHAPQRLIEGFVDPAEHALAQEAADGKAPISPEVPPRPCGDDRGGRGGQPGLRYFGASRAGRRGSSG